MSMIDLHTHVLPQWDDGSDSWETSLDMLRQAAADGITEVACTPHLLSLEEFNQEEKIIRLFDELVQRAAAEKINVRLHLGSELFVQPNLDFNRRIATYDYNRRYFLVEFPMNLIPDFVAKSFFKSVRKDLTPVVAHPERYGTIIENPAKIADFIDLGALLQINAGSLLGIFGQTIKTTVMKLLDANMVTLIASDAHDLKARPLQLKSAYNLVAQHWGVQRAKRLFYENPRRILSGEPIISQEPVRAIGAEKNESDGFFGNLFKRAGSRK